ncbi:Rieske (2Fe-2S) protein [Mastigocladopsis repens]|uniref:Rieske (2Fe-2S) protein n=1 Tax=Mastigocladopsis repens TaxID=221287 RepID=UPI0002D67C0B|nr:Rieske 2Fe-2S domain-containing protein [Mastigocladopsis repens]
MNYVYVASVADVQPGKMKAIVVESKEILLVNVGGQIFAMQRFCPHAGADLCAGKIVDSKVICPKHNAAFDLATGEAVDKAKLLFLKFPTKRTETYRVKVENNSIFVEA